MVHLKSLLAISAFSGTVVALNSGPIVDLGYANYEGYHNETYDLNIWKSIRYAAPPVADLRWQRPHPPRRSKCRITPAKKQPPLCPQSGAFGTPAVYGFNSALGNEDCLYLNVYAAVNATKQPVFIWIHGGGHSVFGATYDPSELMKTNRNGFITVEIQYRLGAFGYLSSDELKERGALNTGLLDQRFAMEWVQQHIEKFGGDPERVTIGGESSGAGSVMFHSLGYGGQNQNLFKNIIAASPYSPPVYPYNHHQPEGNYAAFAELAGCGKGSRNVTQYGSTFDCLVASDTVALQKASGAVSTTRGYFGSFAFLPVVDGDYIAQRPSTQLLQGKLAGEALLVGTNANEGVPLTNPEIKNRAQFDSFVSTTFPNFATRDVNYLNELYQIQKASDPEGNFTRFDTQGTHGPTALTQSDMAAGIQQAAFNIAAENTFQCPAQWMAESFSTGTRRAWKYQFSLTPSFHGADLSSYFSVGATVPSVDFRHAFHKVWGNFILKSIPIISETDATAQKDGAVAPIKAGLLDWPNYEANHPTFMNFNTTGGNVSLTTVTDDLSYHVRLGEGVVNVFRLADGSSWEGGRGERCRFWQKIASHVPY